LRLYTNAVLAAQAMTDIRPFGELQSDASPGVGIGNVNDGVNTFPFVGDIDEMALYNRGLLADEVRGLYNQVRPRTAEETAAVTAAQAWLAEIDAGNYAQSWTDAAEYFQGAITQDKWMAALESVRKPLGKMAVRTLDSEETKTELPGAPDGKYIVMQFKTAYAEKSSATETVTVEQDKDGHWKADGYYIK
jgi:hypothetical protein